MSDTNRNAVTDRERPPSGGNHYGRPGLATIRRRDEVAESTGPHRSRDSELTVAAMAFSADNRRLTSPTAEAIYDAATDLFFHQGFEATSLREIADVVGLKVGSLYNHIRSKEELLFNIMHSVMTTLLAHSQEALDGIPDDDPHGRLRAFLRAGVEFHARHQRAAFIGNSELRALQPRHRRAIVGLRDTYQQELEDLVRAVRDADPDSGIRNVKLAAYAAVAVTSHVATWFQPRGELGVDDVVDGLLDLYVPTAPSRHNPG